jgi:hypothetical protein
MSVQVNMPQHAELQLRKWERAISTSGPRFNGSQAGKQTALRKKLA